MIAITTSQRLGRLHKLIWSRFDLATKNINEARDLITDWEEKYRQEISRYEAIREEIVSNRIMLGNSSESWEHYIKQLYIILYKPAKELQVLCGSYLESGEYISHSHNEHLDAFFKGSPTRFQIMASEIEAEALRLCAIIEQEAGRNSSLNSTSLASSSNTLFIKETDNKVFLESNEELASEILTERKNKDRDKKREEVKEKIRRRARRAITSIENRINEIVKAEKGKNNPLTNREIIDKALRIYYDNAEQQGFGRSSRSLARYLVVINEPRSLKDYLRHCVRQNRVSK